MDKGGPVSCARLEGRHKCSNCYTRLSCTKQDVLFGSLNSSSAERHKVLQDVESRTPWATGLVFRWKCWTSKSNVPAAAQCSMLLVLWNDGNTLARGIPDACSRTLKQGHHLLRKNGKPNLLKGLKSMISIYLDLFKPECYQSYEKTCFRTKPSKHICCATEMPSFRNHIKPCQTMSN